MADIFVCPGVATIAALEWGGLKKQHSLAAIYNLPTYVGEIINTNFNLTEVRGKKRIKIYLKENILV